MKRSMVLLFVFIACSFLLISTAFAKGTLPPVEPVFHLSELLYQTSWDDDVEIVSFDGTTIAANVFTPRPREPGEAFPVLVMPNSWLVEEHEYLLQARKFSKKGYVVLSYSARGWGQSGGLVNVGGSEDMEDIRAVIDWLLENRPVLKDADGKPMVGMCGISLGGGLSLMGAAFDERIRAVMAMVPWGDLADALYLNQSTKVFWHDILLVKGGHIMANLNPELDEITRQLFAHEHEAHFEEILFWAMNRSPIYHLDKYNARKDELAIALSTNLQDDLFTPNQILRFFYALKNKKRLDLNRGIHFSAEGLGLLGFPNEAWERAYAWFDEHLKGMDTGIMDLKPMSIDNKRSDERYYLNHIYIEDHNTVHLEGVAETDTVPELLPVKRDPIVNTLEPETFYLGHRPWYRFYGTLGRTSGESEKTNTIESGLLSGATTGIPGVSSFLEAHTSLLHVTASMPLINRNKAVVYATDAFEKERTILGTPSLTLSLTPSQHNVQLIAHLYTVNKLGVGTLFSHTPITLLESDRLMPGTVPGRKMEVTVNLVTTCVKVPKGHRLMLAIDTYDPDYGKAPVDDENGKDFQVAFHYDDMTRLNIPFVERPGELLHPYID